MRILVCKRISMNCNINDLDVIQRAVIFFIHRQFLQFIKSFKAVNHSEEEQRKVIMKQLAKIFNFFFFLVEIRIISGQMIQIWKKEKHPIWIFFLFQNLNHLTWNSNFHIHQICQITSFKKMVYFYMDDDQFFVLVIISYPLSNDYTLR